jgi:Immunity protein 52
MNRELYDLWAFWGPREEDAAQCAVRLAATLTGWAAAHPVFARWNRKGDTRAQANKPFCAMPPRVDELTKIVKRGLTHKDEPREPWPELGYVVWAWNGIDGPRSAAFHLDAGSYAPTPIFPNSLRLHLPSGLPATADIMNSAVLRKMLLSAVSAWEPAWGSIASYSYEQRTFVPKPHFPRFRSGWMTYLSAPYAARITPPAPAITERTTDGGLLLLATQEAFTIENPEHVAAADAIQAALEPLQPDEDRWLAEHPMTG